MSKSFEALKKLIGHSIRAVIIVGLTAAAGTAYAAEEEAPPNDGTLPAPTSDDDVQPEVATPGSPADGVVQQAGAGGQTGYGRAGVLELGGSLGLQMATGLREVNISPTIGYFLADNFQISGIMGLSYVDVNEDSATLFSLLAEPSYHFPFTRTAFGFMGLGMGASYVDAYGTGFAIAPRLGANFIVGRSGILSPTVSWQYTTHDADLTTTGNTAVVAVSSALRVNVGYTVMW